MDELIKRLKKSLSDFTAKLTDNEGFIQQGKPTLQPIKQAITNWASQPQNYQVANTLANIPQVIKTGLSNLKTNLEMITNPQTREDWFRGFTPQIPQQISQPISNLKQNISLLSNPQTREKFLAGFIPETPKPLENLKLNLQLIKRAPDTMIQSIPQSIEEELTKLGKEIGRKLGGERGETIGEIAGRTIGGLEKGFTTALMSPFTSKPLPSKIGDIVGGVGSTALAGETVGFAALNPVFTTVGTLITKGRLPTKDELMKSYSEGIEFGSKFAPISKATTSITSTILSKYNPQEIKTAVDVIKRLAVKGLGGATGFGTFGYLTSDKTGQGRIKDTIDNAIQGALFDIGMEAVGIAGRPMVEKVKNFIADFIKLSPEEKWNVLKNVNVGLSVKTTKDKNVRMVSQAVKQGHITAEEGQAILEELAKQGGKIKIKRQTTPPPTNLPVGESRGEVKKIKIKGVAKPQTDEFLKGLEEDMKKLQSEPPKPPPPPEPLNLGQGGAGDKANINVALNFDRFKQRLIQALNNINAAKTEGIKVGLQFKDLPKDVSPEDAIKFIENPKNAPKKLEPYIKEVRQMYDQLYDLAQKEGIDMNYVKNYLTHIWDRPQEEVAQLYRQFKTKFKFANDRVLPTYEEGIKMGLKPKYTHPAQIIADYTSKLKQTIEKIRLLRDLEKEGFLVAKKIPGFEPITVSGIEPKPKIIGENKIREGVYYAPPEVAAVLRRAFGEQGPRPFSLPAKIMALWQDIKLSGGILKTPLNAWTFGQVIKEVMAGRPIHALKAVLYSMTEEWANKYFQEHIDDILAMQKRGIELSTSLSLENLTGVKNIGEIFKEKGIGGVWERFFNDPTFKRFSPMLQIDFFSRMKKELINKGYNEELAADIAAKATKNFYGLVDYGEKVLRDKNIEDLITTVFFAPKYRETILNFMINNIKALKNPLSSENIYNTRFMIGAVLTYLAYDKLNRMFNGRSLIENPPGTEDKLLIPVSKITGDENDKTVIGIPIGPSIFTLPRAGARAVLRIAKGDIKGAVGDVISTTTSIGLKTIGDIAMNSDYFGKPIYDEGDDLPTATKKIAQYLFKQTQHPYIAEILDPRNQNDPIYQRLSRAMELPLRFYTEKSLNARYFFQFQDEVLKELNAKEKAAYNSIPKIDEKDPQDPNRRILKYQIYLTYPKVFKAKQAIEIAMAQKLNKEIDPLYLVDYETAKKYMRYETLPEGSPERKAMANVYPELKVLFEKRAEYFKRNPIEEDGQKLAMTIPQPSESVKKKMEEKNWSDPEVKDYLNALREWQNVQRIKLGLPSLDQYGNIEGTRGFSFGGRKTKKIRISLKPPKTKKISIRPKAVRIPKIKVSSKIAKISLKRIKSKAKKPKIKILTS
jgi:polyhydroxyalkanoate synthesis regulator phasin